MVFPNGGPDARHPSQLYEAFLEGLVLFLVLRLLTHGLLKLRYPGFVAGAFVTGYGLVRSFVEFFREPDAQIGYLAGGWLTMGMVLSLPLILVGVWMMASARLSSPQPAAG
jgi:phosphatidylglycerol:prolipoprotein diacylglycerol transferase